jgi:alkylated DNA repair dioxygenase AlkB
MKATMARQAMRSTPRSSEQLPLFSPATIGPQGFQYSANFITPAIEQELIARIQQLPLLPFQFGAFEGKRRVASFGRRYDYTERRLVAADDVQGWAIPIISRVESFDGLPPGSVRQVLCTEYGEGVGIGWHRDRPPYDKVFGLSLGSPCKFRFRRKTGSRWERFSVDAQPRSLYLMSGESRHVWEHSIPAVDAPRYSITFRTLADR